MRTCAEVAKEYPNIEYQDMIVDVMVTPNLYGNIIENLGAGFIGGAGLLPGASYSSDIAFFGAGARYTFNSGAGLDICNPTAMFCSAGNMLAHVGLNAHGASIKSAVRKTLKQRKFRTLDIGGQTSCSEFTDAVINNL